MIAPYYVLHMLDNGSSVPYDPIHDVPLILVIYALGNLLIFIYICATEYKKIFPMVCLAIWNVLFVAYTFWGCTYTNIWFDTEEYEIPLKELNVLEQSPDGTNHEIYIRAEESCCNYIYTFCIKDENDEWQLKKASGQESKIFEEENCKSPYVVVHVATAKDIPILNPYYGEERVCYSEFHVPIGTIYYDGGSN